MRAADDGEGEPSQDPLAPAGSAENSTRTVRRVEVVARGEDEATELIREFYDEGCGAFRSDEGVTEFALRSAAAGDLHVERITNSFEYRCDLAPMDQLVFFDFVHGGATIGSSDAEWSFGAGDLGMYRRGITQRVHASRIETTMLGLPWRAVTDVAESMGVDGSELEFASMVPASPALGRQWRLTMRYVLDVLVDEQGLAAYPLVGATLQRLAAAAAVATFPNTTMTAVHRPGPGFASPASVRRAMDYIDAHASEPISLPDIAGAAGVTGRALQLAFRRHHGVTPMTYLRQVRLDAAHRELAAADPAEVSVSQVAARHGFGSPNRFTSWYRASYGVPPSSTLRS